MGRVIALVLFIAVAVGPAFAQTAFAQAPVTLAFATLDAGSAWYVYGATPSARIATRGG